MRRVGTDIADEVELDLHGVGKHGYQGGNSSTGRKATQYPPEVANVHQEELANAIEGFGLTLDGANKEQLKTVLEKFVRHDANQSLTTPQKAQARSNIGAISSADSITGNAATASAASVGSALETGINSKPTTNQIKGTAVHSAQAWANIKVGEPHFLHPVTADALNVGLPSESNYNEFIKTGYRDLGNGWSGISINYLLEDMYFGGAGSGSNLPTWKRVINDTNFSYYTMPKPQTTNSAAIGYLFEGYSHSVLNNTITLPAGGTWLVEKCEYQVLTNGDGTVKAYMNLDFASGNYYPSKIKTVFLASGGTIWTTVSNKAIYVSAIKINN